LGSTVLSSPLASTTGSLTHIITGGRSIFTIDCDDGNNTDEAVVNTLPEYQET
jgi:hypothetical protein